MQSSLTSHCLSGRHGDTVSAACSHTHNLKVVTSHLRDSTVLISPLSPRAVCGDYPPTVSQWTHTHIASAGLTHMILLMRRLRFVSLCESAKQTGRRVKQLAWLGPKVKTVRLAAALKQTNKQVRSCLFNTYKSVSMISFIFSMWTWGWSSHLTLIKSIYEICETLLLHIMSEDQLKNSKWASLEKLTLHSPQPINVWKFLWGIASNIESVSSICCALIYLGTDYLN